MIFSLSYPLQNIFSQKTNNIVKSLALVLTGAALLAFASQLSIPFQPVPLTFQSATVIFLGLIFGSRFAIGMVTTYLVAGIIGIPVFADASFGIAKFFGPTGGYLVGFLPAAAISGWLAENGFAKNILSACVAAFIGVSVIFLFGYIWLAQFVGWQNAYVVGVKLFLMTECVKLLFVAGVAPLCWRKAN